MFTHSILAISVFAASIANGNPLLPRVATCKADNCLRGITQTSTVYKPSLSVRLSDCSKFMTTTVTPQVTTITISNTATTTTSVTMGLAVNAKRQNVVPPAPTQPAYATWCANPSAYSRGCSCAGITTKTVTATTPSTTVTVTATATAITTVAPALCNNDGLEFAFFKNPYFNSDPPAYTSFDATHFKTATPVNSGVIDYVGISGAESQLKTLYGQENVDPGYLAAAHRGYLYATQTGTYTFTSNGGDDIVDAWLGLAAYSGWTRSNTLLEDLYRKYLTGLSVTQNLVAGTYYPFRILYGNGQGVAALAFTITAPDGSVVLDANTGASTSIVRFSCDGVIAPAYPAWGSES